MQLNATSSPATATRSERVLGRLGFLRPTRDKPAIHIRPLGNGERSALPDEAYETRDVWVEDVRGRRGEFSLDREGVRFIDHRSSVTDWFDAEQLSERYYREAEDLIREATGARRVIVFDHTLRAMSEQARRDRGTREAVSFVHADYTDKSGPQRIVDLLGEAEAGRAARVAFYNLWRPINEHAEANPLAYVDGATLDPESLVATDLVYPDRVGEVAHALFDPKARLIYLGNQSPDEVALFKTFDTRTDVTRFIPHGAFHKLSGPAPTGDRMSVELRTIALF